MLKRRRVFFSSRKVTSIICSPKVRLRMRIRIPMNCWVRNRLHAFRYRKYLIMKTVTCKNSVHLSGSDPKISGFKTLLGRHNSVPDPNIFNRDLKYQIFLNFCFLKKTCTGTIVFKDTVTNFLKVERHNTAKSIFLFAFRMKDVRRRSFKYIRFIVRALLWQ